MDDQEIYNYTYDRIGNLTADVAEGIEKITWNVYGKIKKIVKEDESGLVFDYDAAGNRIGKTVIPVTGDVTTTYYVLDAQGNVMAVYTHTASDTATFVLNEQHIYGSSRIGMVQTNINMLATFTEDTYFYRTLGEKRYELSNHLGNVLSVISDRRLAFDTDANGTTNYYEADVMSAQDYDPFGMLLVGRSWSVSYRYGFNGYENVDEIFGTNTKIDFGKRIYDSRLAKFFTIDPKSHQYPWQSPYAYYSNCPIFIKDILGAGGGEDPVIAYHNTDGKGGAGIMKDGFKGEILSAKGYNFLMTDPSGINAGKDVIAKPVQIKYQVDVSGAEIISYQKWHQWYKDAEANLKSQGVTDPVELQTRANAVRNQTAAEYMNNGKKDMYIVETTKKGSNGQRFIVAKDAVMNFKAEFIGFTKGYEKVEAVGKSIKRVPSQSEINAAEARFGTNVKYLNYGGKLILAVAITADVYEIYQSNFSTRTITSKVGSWSTSIMASTSAAEYASPLLYGGPWGWVGYGAIVIGAGVGGYIVGQEVTETVYDYFFQPGTTR